MGFVHPVGALALVAVAILVAITRAQRGRTRRVSSLLLWQQVPAATPARRRFRPDLPFLLQLVIVLALIAGFVRPYLVDAESAPAGPALIAVLDCSASMQTVEHDGSRFELARARLRAVVAEQPHGTRVMLVAAAERPRVALRWSDDRARLAATLDDLAPRDTPTRLDAAVDMALAAAGARDAAMIVVVTDLPPVPRLQGPVRWIQVGRTSENLAITGVTVDDPPFGDGRDRHVVAQVRNFGTTPRETTLEASLDDVPFARRTLALAARGVDDVRVQAPSRGGIVRVRLGTSDALAVDDVAVTWLPPPRPLDLVLVTEADATAAAFSSLVAALPDARLEVVNAAGWRERGTAGPGAGTVGPGQVALFDGLVPDAAGPALFVIPPIGDPVCRGVRTLDGAAVIDWDDQHAIVDDLGSLEALEVGRATQLGQPSWARVVVQAASPRAAFPLLVAGERDGHRQACLGAALPVPLTSSDAMPLLVVILSTLRWIAGDVAEAALVLDTGVPATVPGSRRVIVADRVGARRMPTADGGERLVLANLFDVAESDVGREGGGDWPATIVPRALPVAPARREIGWWLYAAGALLLAAEWFVGVRR